MSDTRYREIEVAGSALEMGRQIGEAAREEVRGFADIALERVNKSVSVPVERAMGVARDCIPYVERYAPHMLDEMRGTSESSGVSMDDLMMLQVRNQLQAEADSGCTSFSLTAPAGHGNIVGQNWDNDPGLNPYTIVLTRRPEGKPAILNITQAGIIAYIGLNSEGIGLCLNTLPAPSRPVGVPHYFTVRGIYETATMEDAVQAVRRARRAIPANIILSTPQGPADLEVTLENVHVIRDDGVGLVTHTNHCEHPELAHNNDVFPELIQSGGRKIRIQKLFNEMERPFAIESLKAALSDHEDHPTSICRHPNDHPTTGYWATTFSVIIETDAGRMHVSKNNPCQNPYETYLLN